MSDTHPQDPQGLSDEEIRAAIKKSNGGTLVALMLRDEVNVGEFQSAIVDCARAVIAAHEAKKQTQLGGGLLDNASSLLDKPAGLLDNASSEGVSDEPVARVNSDGFIVETSELLLAPGTKLFTRPAPKNNATGWPIRGVRVDNDKVIISVKGGNDAARWLCGEILATSPAPKEPAAQPTGTPGGGD